jgi:hypothetical protein
MECQPFPGGIPALSSYIHHLGLKFGMYEDGGVQTCGGPPAQAGSLGNLQLLPKFYLLLLVVNLL